MSSFNKNKKARHSFKTPSRFRLSFINENTFNTIWTIRFSRVRIIFAVIIILIAITSMVSMLILFTPVRTLLPGYLKESQRQQVIASSLRVDSLLTHTELNSSYIANLRRILNMPDDTINLAAAMAADSVFSIDSLRPASDVEKQFVRQFDEQEKFNIKVLSPIAAEGLDFFPPVAGPYTTSQRDEQATSITLTCAPQTPITAVLDGSVIDCYKIYGKDYTVIIQHPNGFVSKYTGISSVFVNPGEKVESGTPIGITGNNTAHDATQVFLELWNKGTKLNPWDYIPFF